MTTAQGMMVLTTKVRRWMALEINAPRDICPRLRCSMERTRTRVKVRVRMRGWVRGWVMSKIKMQRRETGRIHKHRQWQWQWQKHLATLPRGDRNKHRRRRPGVENAAPATLREEDFWRFSPLLRRQRRSHDPGRRHQRLTGGELAAQRSKEWVASRVHLSGRLKTIATTAEALVGLAESLVTHLLG